VYFVRIAMSKPSNATPVKRGRPKVKTAKSRPSITMNADVFKTARKLACRDGLSFSAWIEQLVRGQLETGGADQ